MAIKTRVAPKYAWRCVIIAIVCLVLGVWGVIDHQIVIPQRLLAHERGDVSSAVRTALEPGADDDEVDLAIRMLAEQREMFTERFGEVDFGQFEPAQDEDDAVAISAQLRETVESLSRDDQESWLRTMNSFESALQRAPVPEGVTLRGTVLYGWEIADQAAQHIATIKRPSRFDRPTQWVFIICLPFAGYYFYAFLAMRKKAGQYRLDDDGTLHFPAGKLARDEIADIDMSIWMKKSIAHVVGRNGERVMLDDYKFGNIHLIVGAIASRFYPDQWDQQARDLELQRRKAGAGSSNETDPEESVAPESAHDSAGDPVGNSAGEPADDRSGGPADEPQPGGRGKREES